VRHALRTQRPEVFEEPVHARVSRVLPREGAGVGGILLLVLVALVRVWHLLGRVGVRGFVVVRMCEFVGVEGHAEKHLEIKMIMIITIIVVISIVSGNIIVGMFVNCILSAHRNLLPKETVS
jgi:hypothetical protein